MNPCPNCGTPLEIRVTGGWAGTEFGPDGFDLYLLDPVWEDAEIVCPAPTCDFATSFGAWQESAASS